MIPNPLIKLLVQRILMKGSAGANVKKIAEVSEVLGGASLPKAARRLGQILSGRHPIEKRTFKRESLVKKAKTINREVMSKVHTELMTPLGRAKADAAQQLANMRHAKARGSVNAWEGASVVYGNSSQSVYIVRGGKIAEMRLEDLMPFKARATQAAAGTIKEIVGVVKEHMHHMTRRQFGSLVYRDAQRLIGRKSRLRKLRDLMFPEGMMEQSMWKYQSPNPQRRGPNLGYHSDRDYPGQPRVQVTWDIKAKDWVERAPRMLTANQRMEMTRKEMLTTLSSREVDRLNDVVRPWDLKKQEYADKIMQNMQRDARRRGLKPNMGIKRDDLEWNKGLDLFNKMEDRASSLANLKTTKQLGPRPTSKEGVFGHLGDVEDDYGWGRQYYDQGYIIEKMAKKAGITNIPESDYF